MKKPTLSVLDSVKDQLGHLSSDQERIKLLLGHLSELDKSLLKEKAAGEEKAARLKIQETQLKAKSEELSTLSVACDRLKIRMGVLQEEVQSKPSGSGFFGSLSVFSREKSDQTKQEELKLRLDQSLIDTERLKLTSSETEKQLKSERDSLLRDIVSMKETTNTYKDEAFAAKRELERKLVEVKQLSEERSTFAAKLDELGLRYRVQDEQLHLITEFTITMLKDQEWKSIVSEACQQVSECFADIQRLLPSLREYSSDVGSKVESCSAEQQGVMKVQLKSLDSKIESLCGIKMLELDEIQAKILSTDLNPNQSCFEAAKSWLENLKATLEQIELLINQLGNHLQDKSNESLLIAIRGFLQIACQLGDPTQEIEIGQAARTSCASVLGLLSRIRILLKGESLEEDFKQTLQTASDRLRSVSTLEVLTKRLEDELMQQSTTAHGSADPAFDLGDVEAEARLLGELETEKLKSDLHDALMASNELRTDLARVGQERDQQAMQLQAAEVKLGQLKDQSAAKDLLIEDLAERVSRLERDLRDTRTDRDAAKQQLGALQTETAILRENYESQIEQLSQKLIEMMTRRAGE